jgi:hypothetical protein
MHVCICFKFYIIKPRTGDLISLVHHKAALDMSEITHDVAKDFTSCENAGATMPSDMQKVVTSPVLNRVIR